MGASMNQKTTGQTSVTYKTTKEEENQGWCSKPFDCKLPDGPKAAGQEAAAMAAAPRSALHD